tara:strand:- start:3484 stop:3591 length:108 start_codon:yes stop_codon:yes gene_type:complete
MKNEFTNIYEKELWGRGKVLVLEVGQNLMHHISYF